MVRSMERVVVVVANGTDRQASLMSGVGGGGGMSAIYLCLGIQIFIKTIFIPYI